MKFENVFISSLKVSIGKNHTVDDIDFLIEKLSSCMMNSNNVILVDER